jgi:hypothetical protein
MEEMFVKFFILKLKVYATSSFAIFPVSCISYASNDEYSFENGMTQTLNTLKTVSRDSVSYKFPIFVVITKKDLFHKTFNMTKFKEIFIKFQGNDADEALEFLQFYFENFDPKIKYIPCQSFKRI